MKSVTFHFTILENMDRKLEGKQCYICQKLFSDKCCQSHDKWNIKVLGPKNSFLLDLSYITGKIPIYFTLLRRSRVFEQFPNEILFKILSFVYKFVFIRAGIEYDVPCWIYEFKCCNLLVHGHCRRAFLDICPYDNSHMAEVDCETYNESSVSMVIKYS